jgi:hypothetical protein
MYCHACGIALTQPTKYCNRCGVQLVPTSKDTAAAEKKIDDYLDGVFWVSVFGLGLIVGGTVLLKKFGFGDLILIIYASLSSTVFLINLGLNLWNAVRLMRRANDPQPMMQPAPETAELNPARPEAFLTPAHSVTENTTRSFEYGPRGVNRSGSE